MPIFAGDVTTYHDVRMFTEATFGQLDESSELQMLVYMGNVLDQLWADIRRSPWYLTTWEVTAVDDVYAIPSDVAQVCKAIGTINGVGEEPDTEITYDLHAPECVEGVCGPAWGTVAAVVWPDRIEPEGDAPNTITLTGYRRPSHVFFEVEETEGGPCRVWSDIDLPAAFRNVYAKALVGFMFFGAGDHARGGDWLNLANSEFGNLKRANPGVVSGTPRQQGMYRAASRSYLSPLRCCDLEATVAYTVETA